MTPAKAVAGPAAAKPSSLITLPAVAAVPLVDDRLPIRHMINGIGGSRHTDMIGQNPHPTAHRQAIKQGWIRNLHMPMFLTDRGHINIVQGGAFHGHNGPIADFRTEGVGTDIF